MATTTPNYGWTVPTSSDLVKNGATAIETLGDSVDASLWSSGYGQAGKNKIINGNFGIWARGTSFTSPSTTYTADRFTASVTGTSPVVSRQTFSPGTAPVSGYESQYFWRAATAADTNYVEIQQKIEDVRTFAGQTVTLSFWAKATSSVTFTPLLRQNFGSGGSANVDATGTAQVISSASWTRYSVTVTLPSISGKTVGTSSFLGVIIYSTAGAEASNTIDFWGIQLEVGSYATPFQTASGGSPQAELTMCQRYYWRASGESTQYFGTGCTTSTTAAQIFVQNPVPMRVKPSSIDTSGLKVFDTNTSASATAVIGWNAPFGTRVDCSFTGLTANRAAFLFTDSTGHLGFSAEL
jgi:hypothetical protein